MLTVTEDAGARLLAKLARKQTADDEALRFTRKPGGWRLELDRPRPADRSFSHKGRKVLLLDRTVSQSMTRMALVVRDTEAGPRLRLRRIRSREDSPGAGSNS